MKKNIFCIVLCTLFLCTSCADYFNTPSQSQLTTENFYSTPAQIDQALTGLYGALKPYSKYYY